MNLLKLTLIYNMQIVWFKRDLRVFDNEALKKASDKGPILPLYIFEEDLWKNLQCVLNITRF